MTEKLTQDRVKDIFDFKDGKLLWKTRKANGGKAGQQAGWAHRTGYHVVSVDSKRYLAHRIIWLWHNGYLPENQIDHINRNRADNRICNLREVTQTCNNRNTGNPPTNTSGIKGVSCAKRSAKWMACIRVAKRTIYLGRHADFTEAVCHRLAAEQALDWDGCDSSSPAFKYVRKFQAPK